MIRTMADCNHISVIPRMTAKFGNGTYLHEQLTVLLDRLVRILDLLLLLALDRDVEVDLGLLVLEVGIELVCGAGLGLGTLRLRDQHLGLDENRQTGIECLLVKSGALYHLVV